MSSNHSITSDKNKSAFSRIHVERQSKQARNRLVSDKFRKLILERRSLSKKNSLNTDGRKICQKNSFDDDKINLPAFFKSDNHLVDGAPNKEAIVTNKITTFSIENLVEQNIGILSQSRSHDHAEELSRLIKKITLSFTAKKNESQFVIKDGIFHGSKFNVVANDKQLSLKVSDVSTLAEEVLRQHESILKYRLRRQEINLHSITFIS